MSNPSEGPRLHRGQGRRYMDDEPNVGGRPPHYTDPKEFAEKADAYFLMCKTRERRPTVNGLALALGFNSRQSLLNYAERDGFMDIVKRVRTQLEDEWEQGLSGPNAAGTIFWLKNQGWTDKNETALTGANGGPVETVTRIKLADLEG